MGMNGIIVSSIVTGFENACSLTISIFSATDVGVDQDSQCFLTF